ncbi:MAG: D-alanine--D-alanine ligase [Gammaproteobacteria bacterium]|nr:D-alanine--D-alanine ligase [Gammaproteobacteria bacterium]
MINNSLRIAVVNGGQSAEAEVSRSSARGVIKALKENYEHVASIDLDQQLATSLQAFSADVVFPVLHGPPGEDGTFQGFLEILGYPYVGSDVQGSAFAMDKIVAKSIFRQTGLPLARETVVNKSDGVAAAVNRIVKEVGHYVVVKPASQGSALGVTLIDNENQLHDGVESAFAFDKRLLVEERIDGREITVGIIDTDKGCEAFPVIEIITPENTWYDYEHRYTEGLSEHIMPADLPGQQNKKLQEIAITAHQSLGCRDLSRADFIVAGDDVYLLEVNTLPGMTPTSLYPDGAIGYGLNFAELVSYLVERAVKRHQPNQPG